MHAALGGAGDIERALRLVGELLEARGHQYHIVVIGGAAMNLLGFVSRATTDVDILAFATRSPGGALRLGPPEEPLPKPLQDAADTVVRDLGLDPHWLNTGPASQWQTGLPPGLEKRMTSSSSSSTPPRTTPGSAAFTSRIFWRSSPLMRNWGRRRNGSGSRTPPPSSPTSSPS